LLSMILRLSWLIPVSLAGYYFWGFEGFIYGAAMDQFLVLFYNVREQVKAKLIIVKYELIHLAFMLATFAVTLGVSTVCLRFVPTIRRLVLGSP